MTRFQFSIELQYDIAPPGSDFVFNIHAAQTEQQTVIAESLRLSQPLPHTLYTCLLYTSPSPRD